jgi:hypothetical protein
VKLPFPNAAHPAAKAALIHAYDVRGRPQAYLAPPESLSKPAPSSPYWPKAENARTAVAIIA